MKNLILFSLFFFFVTCEGQSFSPDKFLVNVSQEGVKSEAIDTISLNAYSVRIKEDPNVFGKVDEVIFNINSSKSITFKIQGQNPYIKQFNIESKDESGWGYWLNNNNDPHLLDFLTKKNKTTLIQKINKVGTVGRTFDDGDNIIIIYDPNLYDQDLEIIGSDATAFIFNKKGDKISQVVRLKAISAPVASDNYLFYSCCEGRGFVLYDSIGNKKTYEYQAKKDEEVALALEYDNKFIVEIKRALNYLR